MPEIREPLRSQLLPMVSRKLRLIPEVHEKRFWFSNSEAGDSSSCQTTSPRLSEGTGPWFHLGKQEDGWLAMRPVWLEQSERAGETQCQTMQSPTGTWQALAFPEPPEGDTSLPGVPQKQTIAGEEAERVAQRKPVLGW